MSVKPSTPHSELLAAATMAELDAPSRHQRIELVREHGSFAAALREIPHRRGSPEAAERALSEIRRAGFEPMCMTDARYPRLLRAAPDPPYVLSVWGRLEPDDGLAIAVVGSRRATHYGLEMSRRLARGLSSAGLTIVSGLARGIDAAAHRGALDASGRTIAVLGSGLDNIYPREHRQLAERVANNGAVLSELSSANRRARETSPDATASSPGCRSVPSSSKPLSRAARSSRRGSRWSKTETCLPFPAPRCPPEAKACTR